MYDEEQPSRWPWAKVSWRRVAGNALLWLGAFGMLTLLWRYVDGESNPSVDVLLLFGSVAATVLGSLARWRVKSAPWP